MEKRRLIMDLLSNLVAFLVFFNIFAFVFVSINGRMPWAYLLLALPFFALVFVRSKIKKFRYFFVIHLALLVLAIVTQSGAWISGIPVIGFAIVSIGYSVHMKIKGEMSLQGSTAIWVIIVLAALSLLFANAHPDMESAPILINVSSLASLAALVLYMHLDNMRFSLKLLGEKDHRKQTAGASHLSNLLITIFLIIIVIFGALSVIFPSDAAALVLLRLAGNILLLPFQIILWVLGLILPQGEGGYELIMIPEEFFYGYYGADPEIAEEEVALWIRVMGIIVAILAGIIVAAAVIGLIVLVINELYKAFSRKNEEGKQSLMPDDVITKLKFVMGDFRDLLPRFRLAAKHPIRRAYIKKINSHVKRGFILHPHYTPEKIADKIRPTEDIDELTEKYEEVRYGRL